MKPAIVLSGYTAALGIVRSLAAMGVPVVLVYYGDHDFAGRSRYVHTCLRAPHPEKSEREFIDFLVECGKRFPGAVLFPALDDSLIAVSRHKALLEQYFRVACTEWEVTQRYIDKQITYALAERCGVPAPRTLNPHSLEEARSGARELGLPCLVKPCQGHLFTARFGRKMVRAETIGQVEETYKAAEGAGLKVMLQELIPGNDTDVVNYNAYVWEGKVLVEFTAPHVRNGPPWFGQPRVVVSRKVPDVIEPGRRMLGALGFSGYACTEFKRDPRDGKYKVLDVNGRHNLSTLLAVRCGINFPWLHYRHLGEGIEPQPMEFREGIYWIDLMRDVGFTAMYLTRERQPLASYFRPYISPHVFAIFDRKDLRPFLRRMFSYKKKKTI
jgi:D-aspartate ligase